MLLLALAGTAARPVSAQTDRLPPTPPKLPRLLWGLRAGVASEGLLPGTHFQNYRRAGGASIHAGVFAEYQLPVPRLSLRVEAVGRREWLKYESVEVTGKQTIVLQANQYYRATDLRLTPLLEVQMVRKTRRALTVGLLAGPSFALDAGRGRLYGERFQPNGQGMYGNYWSLAPVDTTYRMGRRPRLVVGLSAHVGYTLDLTLRFESNGKRPYYAYGHTGLFGYAYGYAGRADVIAVNLSAGYRFNARRPLSQ